MLKQLLCSLGLHRWRTVSLHCAGIGRMLRCDWCGAEDVDVSV